MNCETSIKLFLVSLSDSFPGTRKTQTFEEYFDELKQSLAEVDLSAVKSKLKRECDAWPSIKKILEICSQEKAKARAEKENENRRQAGHGYISIHEFFKREGVKDFSEYIEKKKKTKVRSYAPGAPKDEESV